jgi:hypothetical protein
MKRNNFTRYYRVFKNDTSVTEVSANDFMPAPTRHFKSGLPIHTSIIEKVGSIHISEYTLVPENEMFYGYLDKADAMVKAKAGALNHMNHIIKEIEAGIRKLVQYRNDHYEDLNVNLLDANIQRIKKEMNMK